MWLGKRNVDCMSHWSVCGVMGLVKRAMGVCACCQGMAVAKPDCWVVLCMLRS